MPIDENSSNVIKNAVKRAIVSDLINERIEFYKSELEYLKKAEHYDGCNFLTNDEEVENCNCLQKNDKLESKAAKTPKALAAEIGHKEAKKSELEKDEMSMMPTADVTLSEGKKKIQKALKDKMKVKKGEDFDNNNGGNVPSPIVDEGKVPDQGDKVNPKGPPNGKVKPTPEDGQSRINAKPEKEKMKKAAMSPEHKDQMRSHATQGAFNAAKSTPSSPRAPSPDEHANRAKTLNDFTPKGKWQKQESTSLPKSPKPEAPPKVNTTPRGVTE